MLVQTDTILDTIIRKKEIRLHTQKMQVPFAELEKKYNASTIEVSSNFYNSVKAKNIRPKIIAEIKRASPSNGNLNNSFSLEAICRAYENAANIVAISVLTEQEHFAGRNEDLEYIATNNTEKKSILRKDFIFDEYQILESRLLGADAYLLISQLFDQKTLAKLVRYGQAIGIEPLVEVHDEEDLQKAVYSDTRCIGFNSRDLKDFQIHQSVHELARQIDTSYGRILESGVDDADYVRYSSEFCDALLIGTYFMKAKSINSAIEDLVFVNREGNES